MRKKSSLWLNRPKKQGTLSVRRKKEKEIISSPFKSPCAKFFLKWILWIQITKVKLRQMLVKNEI